MSAHEGKTPGAHLLMGVGGSSLAFHSATIMSQDNTGRNHQVLIPFDRSTKISVASAFFQVRDETGTPVNLVPILVNSGQAANKTLVLNIVGVTSAV